MGYEADDVNEPWHDVDVEQLANQQLNGVIGGCELTYSGSTMAVTMGAGTALINGVVKQIAADGTGVTLVADGSNKRWATIGLTSAGAMALSSGTAAASSSVEASKPENGTIVVPLAMVKIEAAQTVANSIAVKLDKRVPITSFGIYKSADETVNTSATLQNDDDFYFYVNASEKWQYEFSMYVTTASTTPGFKFGWSLPSGATVIATSYPTSDTAAAQQFIADADAAASIGLEDTNTSVGIKGTMALSSTSGLVRFQWAQGTSNASNTVVKAGSYMLARRLA